MKKKTMLELKRLDVEQYHSVEKIPLVVVLDDVRSLNNIGSIFRTSDAFLVDKIFLCGITATPPSPDIHKTALGAENSVEWAYYENVTELVDLLDKLFGAGFNTEKKILAMQLEDLEKINNLTSSEMMIIIEFKRSIKNKQIIAFLSGYKEKGNDKNEKI